MFRTIIVSKSLLNNQIMFYIEFNSVFPHKRSEISWSTLKWALHLLDQTVSLWRVINLWWQILLNSVNHQRPLNSGKTLVILALTDAFIQSHLQCIPEACSEWVVIPSKRSTKSLSWTFTIIVPHWWKDLFIFHSDEFFADFKKCLRTSPWALD